MKNKFLSLFVESFKTLINNPIIILPTLVLLIFLTLFSRLSVFVNRSLTTTPTITAWLILFLIISFAVMSFLFSSLIGMSKDVINKKSKFSSFFTYGKKFWLKNLVIIILILVIYNVIRLSAHYSALSIGKFLSLGVNSAQLLFFFIFVIGLIAILIFLTFASFYLIIKESSIGESIKSSASLVKSNYPYVLTIIIIFFAISQLLSLLNNQILFDTINAILIIPYFSIILTRFVMQNS